MKNFGFAALVAGVMGAAFLGYAAPAIGSLVAEPTTTISADTSHHVWLDQIGPVVSVPQVDTSVHQSR